MNIEELREYCLSVKGSTESTPFLYDYIVAFKVMDKMFAFFSLEPKDRQFLVCLKCNPERSVDLRERYGGIAQTMYKTLLWNAVYLESDVPDILIRELIDHSVEEVIKKLPKRSREEYRQM